MVLGLKSRGKRLVRDRSRKGSKKDRKVREQRVEEKDKTLENRRINRLVIRSRRIRGLKRINLGLAVKEMLSRDNIALRRKQEVVLKRVISKVVEMILVIVSIGCRKSLM